MIIDLPVVAGGAYEGVYDFTVSGLSLVHVTETNYVANQPPGAFDIAPAPATLTIDSASGAIASVPLTTTFYPGIGGLQTASVGAQLAPGAYSIVLDGYLSPEPIRLGTQLEWQYLSFTPTLDVSLQTPAPEPATWALLLTGAFLFALVKSVRAHLKVIPAPLETGPILGPMTRPSPRYA